MTKPAFTEDDVPRPKPRPPRQPGRRRPAKDDSDQLYGAKPREKVRDPRQAKIDLFKQQFGFAPGDGALVRHAAERRARRSAYDATQARELLTDWRYLDERRAELEEVCGGHYLIDQIGLRVAAAKHARGVAMGHDASTPYARTRPSDGANVSLAVVAESSARSEEPDVFVNSPAALDRVLQFFKDLPAGASLTHEFLKPGICAVWIDGVDQLDRGERAELVQALARIVGTVGATPSPQQADKYSYEEDAREAPLAAASCGNVEKLASLSQNHPAVAALGGLAPDHPCAAIGRSAARLIGGLDPALAALEQTRRDELDRNLLVQDALAHLEVLARSMAASIDDSAMTGKLYEMMVDDLFTVLASAKPFKIADFAARAKAALLQRSPALGAMHAQAGVAVEPYLLSSGMEALTASVGTACAALQHPTDGVQRIGTADYFEAAGTFGTADQGAADPSPVMRATLHPSFPSAPQGGAARPGWTPKQLVALVLATLQAKKPPVVLILDATVELPPPGHTGAPAGSSDIDEVMAGLRDPIADGTLKIVVCKSYQKYLSLGTAKVMAGGATVVGKPDKLTEALNAGLGKVQDALQPPDADASTPLDADEMQLMTHMVGAAPDLELAMLQRAATNARLASSLCGFAAQGMSEDGLPFLVTPTGRQLVAARSAQDKKSRPQSVLDLCRESGLEERDSFGYPAGSYMQMQDEDGNLFARITPGQEAPSAVLEKLHALGTLLAHNGPVTPEVVEQLLADDVTRAMAILEKSADPALLAGIDLKKITLARKLALVAQVTEPVPLDRAEAERAFVQGGQLTGAQRRWRGKPPQADAPLPPEVEHLGSLVASCLRLATALQPPKRKPEDGPADARRKELYEAFIDADLPGVSPQARRQALLDWAALARDALKDAVTEQPKNTVVAKATVGRMVQVCDRMRGDSERAEMFKMVSDGTFEELGADERSALVDKVYGKLGVGLQIDLLRAMSPQLGPKLLACAASTAARLRDALDGRAPLPPPNGLPTLGASVSAATAREVLDELAKQWVAVLVKACADPLRNCAANADTAFRAVWSKPPADQREALVSAATSFRACLQPAAAALAALQPRYDPAATLDAFVEVVAAWLDARAADFDICLRNTSAYWDDLVRNAPRVDDLAQAKLPGGDAAYRALGSLVGDFAKMHAALGTWMIEYD